MLKKHKKNFISKFFFIPAVITLIFLISCTMPETSSKSSGKSESKSTVLEVNPDTLSKSIKGPFGAFTDFRLSRVTDQPKSIEDINNDQSKVVIANVYGCNEGDTCNVRFINDRDDGILDCFLQEETSADSETTHSGQGYGEQVHGLFVDACNIGQLTDDVYKNITGDGNIYDANGNFIGQAVYANYKQSTRNSKFILFTLNEDYDYGSSPVVFASVRTYNHGSPVHVRIKDVRLDQYQNSKRYIITGFMEEWACNDGEHQPERIDFLILKKGIHTLGYVDVWKSKVPFVVEVGSQGMTHDRIDWDEKSDWVDVDFITHFQSRPTVLSQTQTYNETDQCVTRNRRADEYGFQVIIQEEESRYNARDRSHEPEDIAYLAYGMMDLSILNGYSFTVRTNGSLTAHPVDNLRNENGDAIQLKGMSSFWLNWDPGKAYANDDVIAWLIKDWKITVYRAAMGVRPTNPDGLDLDEDGMGDEIDQTGYYYNREDSLETVEAVIKSCICRGIYVIVDWHVHDALRPGNKEAAIEFFSYISEKYGAYENIIYEIWNEPGWSDNHVRFPGFQPGDEPVFPDDQSPEYGWVEHIKPYCIDIITTIREHDPDNIIICPTPCWDQWMNFSNDPNTTLDPITSSDTEYYNNLMYAFHFYAGSHVIKNDGDSTYNPTPAALVYWGDMGWRDAMYTAEDYLTKGGSETPNPTCYAWDPNWPNLYRMMWNWNFDPWIRLHNNIDKIPIFVTEWGTTTYDGGNIGSKAMYYGSSEDWFKYMRKHNLSWCNWSIGNKDEGSAALYSNASTSGGWSDTDLRPSGRYARNKIQE